MSERNRYSFHMLNMFHMLKFIKDNRKEITPIRVIQWGYLERLGRNWAFSCGSPGELVLWWQCSVSTLSTCGYWSLVKMIQEWDLNANIYMSLVVTLLNNMVLEIRKSCSFSVYLFWDFALLSISRGSCFLPCAMNFWGGGQVLCCYGISMWDSVEKNRVCGPS